MHKVFLSTTRSLCADATLLRDEFIKSYTFYLYCDDGAAGNLPSNLIYHLDEAELLVAVIGDDFGKECDWSFPTTSCVHALKPCPYIGKANTKSYVQWEFATACAKGLEIHVHRRESSGSIDGLQSQFMRNIEAGNTKIVVYDGEKKLLSNFRESLDFWKDRKFEKLKNASELQDTAIKLAVGILLFTAIIAVWIVVWGKRNDYSLAVIAALGSGPTAVAVCIAIGSLLYALLRTKGSTGR